MKPTRATSHRCGPGPVDASEPSVDAVLGVAAVVAVESVAVAVVTVAVAVVTVVVADPPPPPLLADAVAITGAAGLAEGVTVVMPDLGMVLFGYVVQVRLREAPDTWTEIEMEESRVRLMAPPDAVKGPSVSGGLGRCMETPAAGTGFGIGALI